MSVNHGANLYDLSDKYGFSKDEFLDFSSNINPFGTSTLAKEYTRWICTMYLLFLMG